MGSEMSSMRGGSWLVCLRKIAVGRSSHHKAREPSRDALWPEKAENIRHDSRKSYGPSQIILMRRLYII